MSLRDRDALLGSTFSIPSGGLWTVVGSDPSGGMYGRARVRVNTGGLDFWIGADEFARLIQTGKLVESERVA